MFKRGPKIASSCTIEQRKLAEDIEANLREKKVTFDEKSIKKSLKNQNLTFPKRFTHKVKCSKSIVPSRQKASFRKSLEFESKSSRDINDSWDKSVENWTSKSSRPILVNGNVKRGMREQFRRDGVKPKKPKSVAGVSTQKLAICTKDNRKKHNKRLFKVRKRTFYSEDTETGHTWSQEGRRRSQYHSPVCYVWTLQPVYFSHYYPHMYDSGQIFTKYDNWA